ncbi:MAG: helix-turn-helix domain-containing protein [Bacillota bacterium]
MYSISMLGNRIKKARKEHNLSQEELAGATFTKSYISKIERGMVNPSMKALEIIASRLGMPVAYFIGNETEMAYDPAMLLEAQKLFEAHKYDDSLKKLKEILKYKEYIDIDQLIKIYYYIADLYLRLERYNECIEYYNESEELLQGSDSQYAVKLYLKLGDAYYYLNRRQDSLDVFFKVEDMINDRTMEIDVITRLELYNDIAILCSQLGRKQQSEEYFKKVIDISKKYKIINSTVLSAFSGLAQISVVYEKDADKSLAYLNSDILALYKYFEDYEHLGGIYVKYSNAYYEKGDMDKFAECLLKLEDTIEKISDPKSRAELEIFLVLYKGKLANKEGRYEQAEQLMLKALDMVEQHNKPVVKTATLLNLGSLYLNMNKLDTSIKYLIDCEELSNEIQFSFRLPELYQLMGKVYLQLGDTKKAQQYYDMAFKLLK